MCGRVPGVTQTQSKAQTRNVADAFHSGRIAVCRGLVGRNRKGELRKKEEGKSIVNKAEKQINNKRTRKERRRKNHEKNN